jgi:hypothetical protein
LASTLNPRIKEENMTEQTTPERTEAAAERCIMGGSTESPCPFPATEPAPWWSEEEPELCAFHAATVPLADESDEIGVCLELVRAHLKGARRHPAAAPLVEALERLEADFSARRERVDKVLEDLVAAERRLFRQ